MTKKRNNENPFHVVEADIGAVLNLMATSKWHAARSLKDLHLHLLPAIVTRQFRLVRNAEKRPVAFLSWACVSPEVGRRLQEDEDMKLLPSEWRSGDTAMLIDLVCDDQKMVSEMVARLKREVFPRTVLKVRRKGPGESKPTWREVENPR